MSSTRVASPVATPAPGAPPAQADGASHYRSLIQGMDEGYCLVDLLPDAPGPVQDLFFVETNAAFERHSGLCDAQGHHLRELMSTPPPQDWLDLYGEVADTGVAQRKLHHLGSHHRWFDVSITRMGNAGSRRLALLSTEVTERVHAEAQLREANAALEETDQRKTVFLATLAHELRNPLAPLRNALAVLRQSHDGATHTRMVDLMDRQLDQLVRLVEDLLDMARVGTGKVTLKRQRVDLRDLASHAAEACQPMAMAAGHQMLMELDPQPLWAQVDPSRITQVLCNLLNNAIKYTPHPGHIVLRARREDGCATLSVADDGAGIDAQALPTLFRMFAQAREAREQAPGGLGIGLALVRALVELHGGQVEAGSDGPGHGATFTVHLPLAEATQEDAQAPGATGETAAASTNARPQPATLQTVGGQGLHVLVVDDNADAAESLALILQMDGHVAQVAHDGSQALEMAQRFHPRVVFLDIGMPGMDGYETARRLRALPGEAPVLVALTGWGQQDEDHAHSQSAGFDHHLTKPADPAQVADLLHAIAQAA